MTKSGAIAICCFLIAGILYGSWEPLHTWYLTKDIHQDVTCDSGSRQYYWLEHHTFKGYVP